MDPADDAYGAALRAYHEGEESFEIVERDDGFVGPPGDPALYFSAADEWAERERSAMDRAEGRVLDVGCGAGRHALYLQARGHAVVGIDASPGAVEVSRDRGVDARASATWRTSAPSTTGRSTRWSWAATTSGSSAPAQRPQQSSADSRP